MFGKMLLKFEINMIHFIVGRRVKLKSDSPLSNIFLKGVSKNGYVVENRKSAHINLFSLISYNFLMVYSLCIRKGSIFSGIFFAGIIYHAAMTWIKRVDPQSGLQVEKISTRFNKMECSSGHRLWISNFLVILLAIAPSLAIGKWEISNGP